MGMDREIVVTEVKGIRNFTHTVIDFCCRLCYYSKRLGDIFHIRRNTTDSFNILKLPLS